MSRDLSKLNEEHVIVIYEGETERAINDILYENNKLIYKKKDKKKEIIRTFTGTRRAKKFSKEHLQKNYGDTPVNIIRILDSEGENFKLGKLYEERVKSGDIKVHNIYTKPEIEILLIHSEGGYNEYKKTNKKPSTFCKDEYGKNFKKKYKNSNIKSYDFITQYYKNPDKLIESIKKYHSFDNQKTKKLSLYDLLDIE